MLSKAPIPLPRKLFYSKNECGMCSENGCEVNNDKKAEQANILADMSLSTLICSVERDIELLEQLEMNSGDHRDSLHLPVSAKLLSLPGYRPRGNTGSSSPPPPLPRKTLGHRRHNSDSTINSSNETELEEEFPSTPSSPTDTYMADEITKHTMRQPRTIFCPFCLGHFYHYQDLQDHLLQTHPEELHQVKNDKYHHFKPETCPCCQAEFLKVSICQTIVLN